MADRWNCLLTLKCCIKGEKTPFTGLGFDTVSDVTSSGSPCFGFIEYVYIAWCLQVFVPLEFTLEFVTSSTTAA